MVLNIALKNIRKSYKDYTIYFLTLLVSVATYYAANSIATSVIKTIFQTGGAEAQDAISMMLNIVTGALLFLVIYANKFILSRRTKEMAIYTLFGMSKKKVVSIICIENVIVGVITLIIGCVLGEFASRGIAQFAKELLPATTVLTLPFNSKTIFSTIQIFGIIFLVTLLYNIIYVSKARLIQLLRFGEKQEKIIRVKPWLSFILLVISTVVFIYLYRELLEKETIDFLKSLSKIIVIGMINTFVFMYGLSGLFEFLGKVSKGWYAKGLNAFTFRQLSSKMRTHFISLSIISLLMFFGIAFVTFAMSINHTSQQQIDKIKADVVVKTSTNHFNEKVAKEKYGLELKQVVEIKPIRITISDYYITYNFVSIEEYNRKFNQQLRLKENQMYIYGANSRIQFMNEEVKSFLKTTYPTYEIIEGSEENSGGSLVSGLPHNTIIVPSTVYNKYTEINRLYLFNDVEKRFDKLDSQLGSLNIIHSENEGIDYADYRSIYVRSTLTSKFMMTLFGFYFAFVLVVSAITMIVLQQLSSAADSKEKYRIINYLGASKTQVKITIATQVGLYFILPLLFALINSYIGIYAIGKIFTSELQVASLEVFLSPVPVLFGVISIMYIIYGYLCYRLYYGIVNVTQRKIS